MRCSYVSCSKSRLESFISSLLLSILYCRHVCTHRHVLTGIRLLPAQVSETAGQEMRGQEYQPQVCRKKHGGFTDVCASPLVGSYCHYCCWWKAFGRQGLGQPTNSKFCLIRLFWASEGGIYKQWRKDCDNCSDIKKKNKEKDLLNPETDWLGPSRHFAFSDLSRRRHSLVHACMPPINICALAGQVAQLQEVRGSMKEDSEQ